MAYDRNQAGPFWDWVRSMNEQGQVNNHGEGVDHAAYHQNGPFGDFSAPPFSFGPPPFGPSPFGAGPHHGPPPPPNEFGGWGGWGGRGGFGFGGRGRGGWGGPRGRHGRHGHGSRSPSPNPDHPREDPEAEKSGAEAAEESREEHPRGARRWGHCRGGPHQRGGPHAHGFGHGHRRERGGPNYAGGPPFDFSGLMAAFASHPIAQALRSYAAQAQGQAQDTRSTNLAEDDADATFSPPIDIFSTPTSYVLHIALPGAKKEDVGVNWDAEKNELNVAGVVYRPGDEEFLKGLSKKERKVGAFERNVHLPLEDDKDEVDGDGISAKLEEGLLVVIVPKVEKDWTDIKKVDVE